MSVRTRRRRCVLVVGGVAMALWVSRPPRAKATNENRPRTPAGYVQPGACLQDLDRSAGEVLDVELAIPFEDTELTGDELPDSRTFQFFATCRDRVPGERLPNWVNQDDVDRAIEAGAVDAEPDPGTVLPTGPWGSEPGHDGEPGACVLPITGADARMPISCDATLDGVQWSATGAPVGAYLVRGYTFEPGNNLWTRRPGVVRVHDGDRAEAGPAAALLNPARDGRAYADSPYEVRGCAAGPPGTTAVVQWAPTTAQDLGDDAVWTTVAEVPLDDPVTGRDFAVEFDPPPGAFGQAVLFRVSARAPDGRRFDHHTEALLIVLDQMGESDDPVIGTGPDHCRNDGGTDSTGDGGTDSAGADPRPGGDEACACRATEPGRRGYGSWSWSWLALGLAGVGITRPLRRRRPTRSSAR